MSSAGPGKSRSRSSTSLMPDATCPASCLLAKVLVPPCQDSDETLRERARGSGACTLVFDAWLCDSAGRCGLLLPFPGGCTSVGSRSVIQSALGSYPPQIPRDRQSLTCVLDFCPHQVAAGPGPQPVTCCVHVLEISVWQVLSSLWLCSSTMADFCGSSLTNIGKQKAHDGVSCRAKFAGSLFFVPC